MSAGAYNVILEGFPSGFRSRAGEPILLAGLKASVPLGYECGTGTCGTCKAHVLEGEIRSRWPEAPGLRPDARARGEVLLCQAEALTDCRIAASLLPDRDRALPQVETVAGTVATVAECARDMYRVTIALERPLGFLPGQYVLVELPGIERLRAYSMANAPHEPEARLELYVRVLPSGEMSPRLCSATAVGAQLRVHGPLGRAYLPSNLDADILCIAGGSGLAPILSIARAAARREQLGKRRLHVFFGVRTDADLFAAHELREIQDARPGLVEIVTVLSEPSSPLSVGLQTGLVHEAVSRRFERFSNFEIFLAGPQQMVDACLRLLIMRGARRQRIHYDRFGG